MGFGKCTYSGGPRRKSYYPHWALWSNQLFKIRIWDLVSKFLRVSVQKIKNHKAQNLTLANCETFQIPQNFVNCAMLYCGLYLHVWSLTILGSTYLATVSGNLQCWWKMIMASLIRMKLLLSTLMDFIPLCCDISILHNMLPLNVSTLHCLYHATSFCPSYKPSSDI